MAAEPTIRAVVGEDHPLVRVGIVNVLQQAGVEVVGEAEDAEELLELTKARQPDVVITDIQMPPTSTDDGLVAAKAIRAAWPGIGVVVLSQFLEAQYAVELVSEGAEGLGILAQGPSRRSRGVHRRRSPCGERRLGPRSESRSEHG